MTKFHYCTTIGETQYLCYYLFQVFSFKNEKHFLPQLFPPRLCPVGKRRPWTSFGSHSHCCHCCHWANFSSASLLPCSPPLPFCDLGTFLKQADIITLCPSFALVSSSGLCLPPFFDKLYVKCLWIIKYRNFKMKDSKMGCHCLQTMAWGKKKNKKPENNQTLIYCHQYIVEYAVALTSKIRKIFMFSRARLFGQKSFVKCSILHPCLESW